VAPSPERLPVRGASRRLKLCVSAAGEESTVAGCHPTGSWTRAAGRRRRTERRRRRQRCLVVGWVRTRRLFGEMVGWWRWGWIPARWVATHRPPQTPTSNPTHDGSHNSAVAGWCCRLCSASGPPHLLEPKLAPHEGVGPGWRGLGWRHPLRRRSRRAGVVRSHGLAS
jgi:hypothetical protein